MKISKGQHVVLVSGEHGEDQEHFTALVDFDTDEVVDLYRRVVPLMSYSGHDLRDFDDYVGGTAQSISGRRDVDFANWLTANGMIASAVPEEKVQWAVDHGALNAARVAPQYKTAEFYRADGKPAIDPDFKMSPEMRVTNVRFSSRLG
ncbi:MAG: hypothetical protein ACN6PF_10725 [Achromobacter veterisilvae]